MARRRKSDASQTVSLFPFLSILACVIGTLTLMITALALGQMGGDLMVSAEQLQREQQRLEAELALLERKRQALDKVEKTDEKVQERLATGQLQLRSLQQQVKDAIAKRDEPIEIEIPKVDTEAHQKRMEQLRQELELVREKQKQLQQLLAERKKPPEEAQVRILPSGSGVDLDATFVECDGSGIVVKEDEKPYRIRRADMTTDGRFLALLDKIAKNPKDTMVFLVRENGVGTYYAARNLARSRYARHGKLPVAGKGKIDLSLFDKN
jgi:hypothetical protein